MLIDRMTKEEFEDFVLQHRVTWEQLQQVVRHINHATDDIFDPETSVQDNPPFDNEWNRANKSLQRALRKLHLLKIPLHYDKQGKLYIVRQECGELLFEEHKKELLDQLNEFYDKWIHARNNSKNKEQFEKEYESLLKRANSIMPNEFIWSERKNRYFEFVKDDDAKWLDLI